MNDEDIQNINRTLELRYLLADTIEIRGFGKIVNEGVGIDYIEISFLTQQTQLLKSNLEGLLLSLGFTGNNKINIEDYSE